MLSLPYQKLPNGEYTYHIRPLNLGLKVAVSVREGSKTLQREQKGVAGEH